MMLSLTRLSSHVVPWWMQFLVPCPRAFPVCLLNLFTTHFELFSAHFGLQTSYELRFCCLLILSFGRSAKCPSWVHEQVSSALIYFVTIFSLPIFIFVLSLVEMGSFHRVTGTAFMGPEYGRMRCSSKTYCNKNKRLPPGYQCLISIHPAVEETQPYIHQAQKKGQGPDIFYHQFSPYQNLIQFSLCPHLVSLVSVSRCTLAGQYCCTQAHN